MNHIRDNKRRIQIGLHLRQAWFVNSVLLNMEVWHNVFKKKDTDVFLNLDHYLMRLIKGAHSNWVFVFRDCCNYREQMDHRFTELQTILPLFIIWLLSWSLSILSCLFVFDCWEINFTLTCNICETTINKTSSYKM